MGLVDMMKYLETKEPPKQILSSVDLEGIVKLIKDKKSTQIITMAGAGVSTCKLDQSCNIFSISLVSREHSIKGSVVINCSVVGLILP